MLEQLPERLRSKIEVVESGCWRWTASLRDGYGQIRIGSSVVGAHRLVFMLLVGEIPAGLELDHRCGNRCCVNPLHLDPVDHRTNVLRGSAPTAVNARKTRCVAGHELAGDNIYVYGDHRVCKACLRRRSRLSRHREVS